MDAIKISKAFKELLENCDDGCGNVEISQKTLNIICGFVGGFEGEKFPEYGELLDYERRDEIMSLVDRDSQTYKDLEVEQEKFEKKYNI